MRCPFCGADDTRVVDSRLAIDGDQVRRRRECQDCSERFTTYEVAERILPKIRKSSSGELEAFSEEKLRKGMMLALHKRPVTVEALDLAINRILRQLAGSRERELNARQIGEWVMYELRALDQVAFVRFASIYLRFDSVSEFRDEVNRLEQAPPAAETQLPLLDDEGPR